MRPEKSWKRSQKNIPRPFIFTMKRGSGKTPGPLRRHFPGTRALKKYFAVKATPNPFILKILQDMGCGTDCSSETELMLSKACGFTGHDIMFSSNDTPPEEFKMADELGAIINLDDFTHIACVEKVLDTFPETMSCRFNPGGLFRISNDIMDNPGDSSME